MIPHSRPWITDEDCEAVVAVLRSGMLNEGAATRRLEQWFEHASGGGTAVATGSGSQALLLALRALEVGAGAEVILPTYVCAEVLGVVESLGATARLVDIADDYLINANATAAAITPRTRAIIVPYVMGIRTDIEPLRTHGVPIIEDLAQWLGPVRAFKGDIQVFSFEATKVVAAGEGAWQWRARLNWHNAWCKPSASRHHPTSSTSILCQTCRPPWPCPNSNA